MHEHPLQSQPKWGQLQLAWFQIETPEEKEDARAEAGEVGEATRRVLHGLDAAVERIAQGVGEFNEDRKKEITHE